MGFVFSIPFIIISIIINHYFKTQFSEKWKMKIILNLLFFLGIFGVTAFMSEKSPFIYSKESILPLAYLIISSLSIWFFKYGYRQNQ